MATREELLNALKKKPGQWVSGEVLSGRLGISRAAVSKHVAILKQAGYAILSSSGKGYAFQETSDLILPEEIRHGLETTLFGKHHIEYHPMIPSTNDRAKEMAADGAKEGSLVLAEQQSAGRGRKRRVWFSAPGDGICLSLVLRPRMAPPEASRITLMTAVALAETLISLTSLPVRIKWPNDILIHGRKLAGILTEMSMEMDQVDYVVVGLGLNVNTPVERFPKDIRDIASSLRIETGKPWKRADIIRIFLRWFEHYYAIVSGTGFVGVMRRWKELSDIIGRTVDVDMIRSHVRGQVQDVDDDGILILKDENGEIHRIISGDVLLRDV